MKNLIIVALIVVIGSCNSSKKEPSEVAASTQSFSCPMHSAIIGKKGEKCSECGMEMTEPATAIPDSSSKKN
ncbi:MAG TPA: heavy metal-binding domain-containing protein [Leadbetterella sp.]|nr:heavy metal-binding domain-containing protein [Leadbetterella sp.]